MRLDGKVAVVTGASKGIGAAIAKRLGAEGASVVVNYATSREGADKVVNAITSGGGKAIAAQADVAKQADVTRLFNEARDAYGKVDILVNNAGLYRGAPVGEITEENFHVHFNLNVLGLIFATQEALKYMGEGGSIINVSSVLSTLSSPGTPVYNATKSAVDGLTRTFSKELAPKKIRVNSVNPGLIETEGIHAAGIINYADAVVAMTPLGRLGQPDDIAPVVAFLASADSGWITGECLYAAGGLR
ncbi:3-oxoacyl-[acyl-carrier protein] reductase [Roseimicrobium gellanilyticum]|uniref:3-oxoacyl-[acyl-carrier protein] reductase n=2 Tax=Roseimicrobium gellanilyticum TaxID=748857 RepID=A0A366HAD2_9BACT|nr:glucose 1-dehydrogenase [Roseimicrobium gellanilyticum]RBP39126.1 3-oxoacyl-[acyl-carrier protein] reductase [Roseimicrobium gellanilyticum]